MIEVMFSKSNVSFDANFSEENESFNTGFNETPGGVSLDHRRLVGRDAVDQHPIESIIDLSSELNIRPNQALTNIDLESLLK